MNSLTVQPQEPPEKGQVVTKALLRAAESMGLTAKRLAGVIGASEPTVSRMKAGAFVLSPDSKPYELAVLLIRLFCSLEAIVGGDSRALQQWLSRSNSALGGKPIDKVQTISGLTDVLAYLDARRALV